MIKNYYGKIGQLLIDIITDTLRTPNAALLSYISEQKYFKVSEFSKTQRGEYIEILLRENSDGFQLRIKEETDQDIILF